MEFLYILIAVVVLLVLYYFLTYNKLVSLRNRVKDQWSMIDVHLKRRADLIPNLVETVKGYAKHEKSTLDEVIKARNTYLTADTMEKEVEASNQITQALGKLFALTEAYPDLKANQNFLSLQSDLKETEDKIAVTRQFYNDTVLTYNNKVEMVPSNIVAKMAKFKKAEFIEANEDERKTPKVSF